MDAVLDSGRGSCLLRSPLAARTVAETLLAQQGKSCEITGFVIMPNHVHAVLRVAKGIELKDVMQQLKGGSAYAVNHLINRTDRLWQPDYFDRIIRDEEHFDRTLHAVRLRLSGLSSADLVFQAAILLSESKTHCRITDGVSW